MVQKNSSIKPLIVQDSSIQYENLEKKNMKDPKIISDMVDRISMLESVDHCEIYKTLRKFKPANFFGSSSIETRFNIDKLSVKELEALDQTIRLSKEDNERRHVLRSANTRHRNEMSKLENSLYTDVKTTESWSVSTNPTEVEKIQEMLKMNKL
jgi:hypothetical protein